MPDDFLEKISRLGDKTDDIVPRVLQAGADVVLAKVKSNLQAAIGKGTKYESRSTGDLVKALGITGARVNREGNHDVKVGFSAKRGDGKSNALIAAVLEYGKHGQPPKPFLKPAKSASRKECIDAMTAKLDEEIGKI